MKKLFLAIFCLCGLCGCLNMNDDSTIDESSIVITRGRIRDVYVEAYVDADAKGLKGIDVVYPDRATGAYRRHEMGYTLIYEVYDPQGMLVEKRMQDLGKYGNDSSFTRQELNIPRPQWWSEDNPVYYKLVLRLKIINQPVSTASKVFRLVKDSTDTTL
jgi:beta-galactosidase/beta-glucuronidase